MDRRSRGWQSLFRLLHLETWEGASRHDNDGHDRKIRAPFLVRRENVQKTAEISSSDFERTATKCSLSGGWRTTRVWNKNRVKSVT